MHDNKIKVKIELKCQTGCSHDLCTLHTKSHGMMALVSVIKDWDCHKMALPRKVVTNRVNIDLPVQCCVNYDDGT